MLLAYTPVQAESVLNCVDEDVGVIDSNKIELMRFKQEEDISTSTDKPLNLVDLFKYLGSNILSSESDIYIHQAMARKTIDRLSTYGKVIFPMK